MEPPCPWKGRRLTGIRRKDKGTEKRQTRKHERKKNRKRYSLSFFGFSFFRVFVFLFAFRY
jgi:hypothetical protein